MAASDTSVRGMSRASARGQIKYHTWTYVALNASNANIVIAQPFSMDEKSLEESHIAYKKQMVKRTHPISSALLNEM